MLQRFCFSPWTLLQLTDTDTAITRQGIAIVPRSVLDFHTVIRTIPITTTIGLPMVTAILTTAIMVTAVMGTTITVTITDRTMDTTGITDTGIDITARAIGDRYKSNIFHGTQVTGHTVDIDLIPPQSHGVHGV